MSEQWLKMFIADMVVVWNSDPNMKIEEFIEHVAHTIFSDIGETNE